MHKTLFCLFFLISLLFYSCSSTKSLTHCPSFKKGVTSKKWAKIQKPKNKKKAKPKKLLTVKELNRKPKIVDRLTNRLVKKIAQTKNNSLTIDTLNNKPLYVLLKAQMVEYPSNESFTMATELLKDNKIENTLFNKPKNTAEKLNNSGLAFDFDLKPTNSQYKNTKSVHKKKPKKNKAKKQTDSNNKKIHGLAIAAFVCALTGLGIFALIFGAFAVDRIEEEPEKYRGKTLAIIASILGLIGAILAIGILGTFVSAL